MVQVKDVREQGIGKRAVLLGYVPLSPVQTDHLPRSLYVTLPSDFSDVVIVLRGAMEAHAPRIEYVKVCLDHAPFSLLLRGHHFVQEAKVSAT